MSRYLRSEVSRFREFGEEVSRIKEIIEDLREQVPVDFDAKGIRGNSASSTSVGCAIFTAIGGEGEVMAQLEDVIEMLRKRGEIRESLFEIMVDRGTIERTDRAIKDYVIKSGIVRVPPGKAIQYFACDRGRGRGGSKVCHAVEMPLNEACVGSNTSSYQPWSFPKMLRGRAFDTSGLEGYVNYLEKSKNEVIDGIKGSVEKRLSEADSLAIDDIHKWMESATDTSSDGGILVLTDGEGEPMFCPECIEKILQAFRERGSIRLQFPPIPRSVLSLDVLCTENLHKEHSFRDLISLSGVEEELNELRANHMVPVHRTMMVQIENHRLLENLGPFIWIRS